MNCFRANSAKNQGNPQHKPLNNQAGNALFLIFLGIALFAALSFSASQGFRTGASSVSKEQAKLIASEILDYSQTVKQAVQMLQINGCGDTEISFENSVVAGYNNPSAPTNDTCDVFEQEGAGLRYKVQENWFDQSMSGSHHALCQHEAVMFVGDNSVPNVGTDCGTEDCKELVMKMHFVPKEVCVAINEQLGIANDYNGSWPPPENATTDPGSMSGAPFVGVYYNNPNGIDDGISGAQAACITVECTQSASPSYTLFYQVLIAR